MTTTEMRLFLAFIVPILALCVVFADSAAAMSAKDRAQASMEREALTESVRRSTAAHLARLRTHGMRAKYREENREEA